MEWKRRQIDSLVRSPFKLSRGRCCECGYEYKKKT
jgi:hypothetical protein